jgi:hypothetical protein
MKTYRSLNLITGWVVFLIASVVYILTIEPTTSFWDCGEFITSAYKLEVGHPPGAPFFMLLGRFFALFAANPETVSVALNIMSALASSFTILFLFWTITHLAKKIIMKEGEEHEFSKLISVMAAGVIGSLAYTFSDTFWFSAVEAEVYAVSSLFTAIVFWAILKWENIAEEEHSNKWIILIAYLMGLSIGVHLLNLLAIPAIVFVYYFRKYTPTTKGILASLAISVAILGAMMYLIIPGIVALGSVLELMFVNGFGLPYHSGLTVYVFLLAGLLGVVIWYTHRKRMVIYNTIVVVLTVIALGYSSYGVIIIRSNANTPLDESDPETAFSLLRYLNREQYGQTPLLYGNYFNAPAIKVVEAKPVWYKEEGRYVKVTPNEYEYHEDFRGFFPRMWSDQEQHISQYLFWAKMKESDLYEAVRDSKGSPVQGQDGRIQFDRNQPIGKPTFTQNLRFFFRYQVGYMYLRYFMWNFAGRQNDIQGHGELTHGNWISGISFIDNARLGPQDRMPDEMKNNAARNRYYFLPLLLGLVGMFFHYQYHRKDFWVVSLLFLLTGLAIVVYLNQYPIQPRERDYAYAGSFYAFSIWIGLGVLGLINAISRNFRSVAAVAGVSAASLVLVPGLLAAENWDDHDRSGRYTARDFAYNYLNSCAENAVLFTNGDNDTFPLWYLQETEGVRTDVRVINLSYFTADWYIKQMSTRMYESDPVQFSFNEKEYRNHVRDYVQLNENTLQLLDEKLEANRQFFIREYAELYNRFLEIASRSKLPQAAPKDYEELLKGSDFVKFTTFVNVISRVNRMKADLSLDDQKLTALVRDVESFARRVDAANLPVGAAMRFIRTENPLFRDGRFFFPGTKFIYKVDTARAAVNLNLTGEQRANLQPDMSFTLAGRRGVPKNLLMMMDLIDQVNLDGWKRPVYYAITASRDNYIGLDAYLHREGLAYRLMPFTGSGNDLFSGNVNTEVMYHNLMNVFRWGNLSDTAVYLDENNLRMVTNFRYTFATLANALLEEGKTDSARVVLDRCMELFPNRQVPYNAAIMPVIQIYYALEDFDTANALVKEYAGMLDQHLYWHEDLQRAKPAWAVLSQQDYEFAFRTMYSLFSLASSFQQEELVQDLMGRLQMHEGR